MPKSMPTGHLHIACDSVKGVRSSKVERPGENGKAGGSIPSEPTYVAPHLNSWRGFRLGITRATKRESYLSLCLNCKKPFPQLHDPDVCRKHIWFCCQECVKGETRFVPGGWE